MTLGKGLGNPIGIDQGTLNREYGYFANVLVDIDLEKPIPDKVIIKEEGGGEFSQTIEIPKLLAFCNHCKTVGHNITQYRGLLRRIQEPNANNNARNKDGGREVMNNRWEGIDRREEGQGAGVVSDVFADAVGEEEPD